MPILSQVGSRRLPGRRPLPELAGIVGFTKIAKCSQDTALRDIEALITLGILEKEPGGGRSTSYALPSQGNN